MTDDIEINKLELSHMLTDKIDAALQTESTKEVPRKYLGGSALGNNCNRALQYQYMQVPVDEGQNFSGQTLRIFQAGHVFEELMINWLRLVGFGIKTQKNDGGQFGWSALDGRIQGHVDGIIVSGPAWINGCFPALFEAKSLNDKSWQDTVSHGVKKSKPIYAAQIALYQAYMEAEFTGICANPALFTAINKNTAELYFEWVPFDAELAQMASDRGLNIILSCEAHELLPRVSNNPDYFECRFCAWKARCWKSNKPN